MAEDATSFPDFWMKYSVDIPGRTIYMGSTNFDYDGGEMGVDATMAEYAIKGLHQLYQLDKKKKITVILNSIGGEWTHGMAIYDVMKGIKAPIHVVGTGNIMSMGSVLLQAGDKRFLTPYSTVMIHNGYSGVGGMRHDDAKRWMAYEEMTADQMAEIFAERGVHSADEWKKICENDEIYTPRQAVDLGLADAVKKVW